MMRAYILIIGLVTFSCAAQTGNLTSDDIRLFKGKAWHLAEAVEGEDLETINKVLKDDKKLVQFQEPKFGQTLLHWAVKNGKKNSVRALLENGADPNLQDSYDGESPLMLSAGYGNNYDTSSVILKLLLKNGGNPNIEERTQRREGNRTRRTPLIIASGCCLIKTKILVEAKADINYTNEFHQCALGEAMMGGKDAVYITKYLLMEKDAKIPDYLSITAEGNRITILNYLRNWVFKLDSKEYKVKMEIVDFLRTKGLDYWSSPIPKVYYKNYSKEFLDKY